MQIIFLSFFLFFFSSRRRHTRWTGDWSSDVCSSDLGGAANLVIIVHAVQCNVGLVASAAIESAVARVNIFVDIISDKRDTRLQAEYACSITAFEGKSQDLARVKSIA